VSRALRPGHQSLVAFRAARGARRAGKLAAWLQMHPGARVHDGKTARIPKGHPRITVGSEESVPI